LKLTISKINEKQFHETMKVMATKLRQPKNFEVKLLLTDELVGIGLRFCMEMFIKKFSSFIDWTDFAVRF